MLRSLYEQNPSQVRISINLDAAVFLLRRSCVQVPIADKTSARSKFQPALKLLHLTHVDVTTDEMPEYGCNSNIISATTGFWLGWTISRCFFQNICNTSYFLWNILFSLLSWANTYETASRSLSRNRPVTFLQSNLSISCLLLLSRLPVPYIFTGIFS